MLFVMVFFVLTVVADPVDEVGQPKNDSALALPLYQRRPPAEASLPLPADNDLSDYQAFQMFKYLVYPSKFTDDNAHNAASAGTAFARNITIDEIHMIPNTFERSTNGNNNNVDSSSGGSSMVLRRFDPSLESSLQERRHYPFSDYQSHRPDPSPAVLMYGYGGNHPNNHNNFNNGVTHLADPLFVMATLAFVAFLINSILGLVDRLNLLPLVRNTTKRTGKVEVTMDGKRIVWPEGRDGGAGEQNERNEELLHELEATVKSAFDVYEKCFAEPNQCGKQQSK